MMEPNPAEHPPLTCANDHDGNTCKMWIDDRRCLSASTNALAIIVSSLSTELFNLCREYDALDEQNSHNLNLLRAAMSAHHDGLTAETYSIKQQLEQDLDACWHMIYDLRHHLDDQNLEINSLCHKNEAYECKEQKQDD